MTESRRSTRQTFWQSHLEMAQAQGLSVRAYARREGLSEHSLYAARRQRQAKALPVASAQRTPAFASVRIATVPCELSLPGGVLLRLPDLPSAQWLTALAREISR